MKTSLPLLLLAVIILPFAADATFSIGAVDTTNNLMGAAGASCVYFNSIYDALYVSVPEKDILLTQAKPASHSSAMVETAVDMMLQDIDPSIILGVITDPSLDNTTEEVESECETGPVIEYEDYLLRQYGLVDTQGRYDGYEDETLKEYYEDLCFTEENYANVTYTQEHVGGTIDDTFAFTAQGNIIALPTIPAIVDGFTTEEQCDDIIHRLFQAISAPFLMMGQAVAEDDLSLAAGDIRCLGTNQAAAAGIFLHVEDYSGGNEVIHIDVVNDGRDNDSYDPYPEFVEKYNAWRAGNPCGSFTMGPTTTEPTPSPTSSAARFGSMSFGIMAFATMVASLVVIV